MQTREPKVVRLSDIEVEVGEDGLFATFISANVWNLGLFFMEPGMDTKVFSLEEEEDGTTDEWYGPVREFNYILMGEFTVWWGRDAKQLIEKKGPRLVVRAGEILSYPHGWKYLVQNTGKVPGAYLWGLSSQTKDVNRTGN